MTGENNISHMLRALRFAAENHRDQRRKDADATPYVNHLIEVANILWEPGGVRDFRIITAAILHDLIEDTDKTAADIAAIFGKDIADIVVELTDDMSLPDSERRNHQVDHAASLSIAAAQIKIADKSSNLASLIDSPPEKWSRDKILAYAGWGLCVVDRIRGINPRLDEYFDQVYDRVQQAYGVSETVMSQKSGDSRS